MSVVVESASQTFHDAVTRPASQPSLSALRECQKVLFADVVATLSELPQAPDLLVRRDSIGKLCLFTNEALQRWSRNWPDGVMWLITVAVNPKREALPRLFGCF